MDEESESISWESLSDERKDEFDHDKLMEELSDEFENDSEDITSRLENLGYDIDDLEL